MPQIGIIADDLTGACDTALQFFNEGLSAVVALSDVGNNPTGADAVAVSTNSRNCAPDEAYRKVTNSVNQMRAAGIDSFYKKIDSALRGNIGSELDALMDTLAAEVVIVSSAFPAQNRTVEHGNLYVNGQPLTDTALGRETSVESCAVVEIISRTTQSAVQNINLNVIRSGADRLKQELQAAVTAGYRILVCDAVTNKDLDEIAGILDTYILERRSRWQGAGSAGLAAATARLHSPVSHRAKRRALLLREGGRLVVVGSQHPTARAQLEWLQRTYTVRVIALSADALCSGHANEVGRVAQEVKRDLLAGTDVALTTESSNALPRDSQTAQALAEAMGEILSGSSLPLAALMVVGGDTAMGILAALEAESAEVIAEAEPGVPVLALQGGRYPDLPLITKAGSFGNRKSLALALQFLDPHLS